MNSSEMPKSRNLLLIFTRNPELGKVKKRLAAETGDEAALKVYKFLLKHTAEITRELAADKQVYFSETIEKGQFWDESYERKLQRGQDLGERMKNAFQEGFEAGYKNIIIIGSDLYDLNRHDLEEAFEALEHLDYVIGPAKDGGYYLLGMKTLNLKLFRNKAWSTASVFEETVKDMGRKRVNKLPERNDIDYLEDLKDHPQLLKLISDSGN